MINDVKNGILALNMYHDSIAFPDFGDRGNTCYKPYRDDDNQATADRLVGEVRIAMPKGSDLHLNLAANITKDADLKRVQYDWLCKCVARILANFDSAEDIVLIGKTSHLIRERMRLAGKTEIRSLAEIL